ncbi:MAG: RNB domain-containing ribonuclease, partial [Spirochaetaceae bacterium]|nr:RNB domain-containing ribonuclease [Spirochaetaceae bacterium]
YAIDNAWSNDPDDAVSFDGESVWVHIADPSAYIEPGSALDTNAMERGATLYLPEATIPMLPAEAVSMLGLGLNDSSPALSFKISIDREGTIQDILIAPSLVRVSRLSYEQADTLIDQGEPSLGKLCEIAHLRRLKRITNGAVEINFPEISIKAEENSITFMPIPETRSSGMVREMMLLAGEASARWARERNLPFLYCSQESPSISGPALLDMDSEAPLSMQYARRKGMRASIVGTECLAHRGLGLSFYTQVTSPLRRYQDLLVHFQIRRALCDGQGLAVAPFQEEEITRRSLVSNQAASQTRQAERDARLHWIAVYLSRHMDWQGEASILEIRDREAWVFIKEFGYETSIRCRKPVQLDEIVRVKVARVNIPCLALNFEML